jgi:hypothetical protein
MALSSRHNEAVLRMCCADRHVNEQTMRNEQECANLNCNSRELGSTPDDFLVEKCDTVVAHVYSHASPLIRANRSVTLMNCRYGRAVFIWLTSGSLQFA